MEPSVLSRSRMMGKKTVNSRRIMAAVMVIVMLAALTGCVGKEDTQTRKRISSRDPNDPYRRFQYR